MRGNNICNDKINELKNLLEKYNELGWKIIPLEGKKPFWKGWDDPKLWEDEHTQTRKQLQRF